MSRVVSNYIYLYKIRGQITNLLVGYLETMYNSKKHASTFFFFKGGKFKR